MDWEGNDFKNGIENCMFCSKMTTVSLFGALLMATFFSLEGRRASRLFFHWWRLIFSLEEVDDFTPHHCICQSGSQPGCLGTLGCREVVLGVPPNILNTYFLNKFSFYELLFCFLIHFIHGNLNFVIITCIWQDFVWVFHLQFSSGCCDQIFAKLCQNEEEDSTSNNQTYHKDPVLPCHGYNHKSRYLQNNNKF